MLGAENVCWGLRGGSWVLENRAGLKRCCWGSKDAAGAQKMLLGARNTQLGLKICGWVVKMGS